MFFITFMIKSVLSVLSERERERERVDQTESTHHNSMERTNQAAVKLRHKINDEYSFN